MNWKNDYNKSFHHKQGDRNFNNYNKNQQSENYDVFFGNKQFKASGITQNPNSKKENDVKDFFKKAWENSNMKQFQSISLLLNKYVPIIFKNSNNTLDFKNSNNTLEFQDISLKGSIKKFFLQEINNQTKNKSIIEEFYNKFKERVKKQKESLKKIGYEDIFSSKLKTAYRLVVGLGSGSVFETSLTLHHIFGIPYIPASALKGVVRSVSFWEIAKSEMKKNENFNIEEFQKKLYDENISNSDTEEIIIHKILFGTQEFKGLLIFLDSYPENNNFDIFELDVMTPHYQEYYTQTQTPGDWENPNPITFLTVKKGIPFEFNVLIDKHRLQEIEKNKIIPKNVIEKLKNYEYLKNKVKRWLELALKEFGVGAKTRLGYGIFQEN
jgi:CRISPR-associated protein Cmr6